MGEHNIEVSVYIRLFQIMTWVGSVSFCSINNHTNILWSFEIGHFFLLETTGQLGSSTCLVWARSCIYSCSRSARWLCFQGRLDYWLKCLFCLFSSMCSLIFHQPSSGFFTWQLLGSKSKTGRWQAQSQHTFTSKTFFWPKQVISPGQIQGMGK